MTLDDAFSSMPTLDYGGYLIGADGNDTIRGFGGDDTLFGGGGLDSLDGGLGNDRLNGGTGADQMTGGAGDDSYWVEQAGDVVTELQSAGNDTVYTSLASYLLPANVENLIFTGTGATTLTGTSVENRFTGGAGNDLFDLRQGGDDTANGGGGDDGFYFGSAFDAADIVNGGAGTLDQVALQANYSALMLGAATLTGVENLVLLSGTDTRFGAPGNQSFSYNITSNNGNIAAGQILAVSANTLVAGEGATFNAAAELDGAIAYYGGLGTDVVTGSQQSDGFFFAAGAFGAGDVVNGQGGSLDQLALQGGFSGTFGAAQLVSIENLVLISANDVRFPGGSAHNYTITMADSNVAANSSFAVTANTLAANETLVLNDAAETNASVTIYSGGGSDTLTLGALGDRVFGGAGDDRITGNGGADQLTGGAGGDTFSYLLVTDSTAVSQDHILDFTTGDHIDLSAIGGFNLVSGGFTAANQVRVTDQGDGNYLVEAETTGDGNADLSILVTSDRALTASDFIGVTVASGAIHSPEISVDMVAGHLTHSLLAIQPLDLMVNYGLAA